VTRAPIGELLLLLLGLDAGEAAHLDADLEVGTFGAGVDAAQGRHVVVVAPDVGSAKMARGFAKRLNGSLAIIDKRRPRPNQSEVVNVVGDVEGRDCILTDDMIDTAGTVAEASRALKQLGANDVYVCATHALLSGPAVERLSNAPIKEVTVTDTVRIAEEKHFPQLKILSVGDLLAKAIRYIHSEQSVSSLFEG